VSDRSFVLDYIEPPFTIIPPPDWVLCKMITLEATRGGIILPASTWEGDGGRDPDAGPSVHPIAIVVRTGQLHSGKWEGMTQKDLPWQAGDYVHIGGMPAVKIVGEYIMVMVDAILAVLRPGEHSQGQVYVEVEEEELPPLDPEAGPLNLSLNGDKPAIDLSYVPPKEEE
jgi:hypothetical protein